MDWTSVTHSLPVPSAEAGRDWYARLLGREPDLVPAADVFEWKLRDGAWLQVSTGEVSAGATGQLLRLGVVDLDASTDAFVALGGRRGERSEIQGVITIQDLLDPFGNLLCFYEETDAG